jgi:hypothetical protein
MKNFLSIDSTFCCTELCELGAKYPTDKSPINKDSKLHKHAYTAIYNLLFASLKFESINIAEIGIYHNMSILCWRDFFPNATIYGLDFNETLLNNGKKYDLKDVSYSTINVTDKNNIAVAFDKIGKKMDIIIDDSTHQPPDQINVIQSCLNYVNSGGYLIIEDLFKRVDTSVFSSVLDNMTDLISHYFFIDANHANRYSAEWDNDRLLVIIRK